MSPPQPPEEEKRVGNVFYTPGTKTPRRVQWLDKDTVFSSHNLDEQGLDPAAFERLTQALERHKASLTARVHHYPPQPEPAHTMDISELGSTPRIPISRAPQSYPSLSGMQSNASSPAASSGSTSPHHYVPGNYIDATERVGLPGTSGPLIVQRQAEKVVDSHMRKSRLGEKLKLGKRWNKTKKMRYGGSRLAESEENTDIERYAGIETPKMRGNGVLSTLLSLYGQDSDLVSGTPTPGGCSLVDSPDPDRLRLHSREDHGMLHRPGSRVPVTPHQLHTMTDTAPESPSLSRQSTLLGTETKESKFQQLSPSVLIQRHKRTKTRNGGGVFGPLIASTGNLTGVVAPTQSQLQPDIKRPGYRLSRYSFDEKPQSFSMNSRASSAARNTQDDAVSSYVPSVFSAPRSPPSPTATDPGPSRSKWTGLLKDISVPSIRSLGGRSGMSTPARSISPSFEEDGLSELRRPLDMENWKKRKRKQARVFITRHVAHILERQAFILKFARAMMMFGAPSHRLQSQITSTAHVLDLEMSCVYLPDVLLVSFDDSSTSTSNIKIIRQGSSLDLVKLTDAYHLYWKVIHDKLSVSDASADLDHIMGRPQLYNWWKLVLFGGMCSSSICTGFIVLNGALELMSRNIVAGSVRLCYAIVYALFLGFGLAMGAKAFVQITGQEIVGSTDVPLLVGIACIGWVTNHFTGTAFVNQSDISAAVG
ncbi:hypothetical protein C0993_007895 [Termitomyces sp. T159_Od127]|nr:hypothetical protein C0993_007895 [Termitomyces sp. T159_Od127]